MRLCRTVGCSRGRRRGQSAFPRIGRWLGRCLRPRRLLFNSQNTWSIAKPWHPLTRQARRLAVCLRNRPRLEKAGGRGKPRSRVGMGLIHLVQTLCLRGDSAARDSRLILPSRLADDTVYAKADRSTTEFSSSMLG